MEIVTLILIIVVLVLLISYKTDVNQKLSELEYRVIELQNLLKKREQESNKTEKPAELSAKPTSVAPPQPSEIKTPDLPKPEEKKPDPILERQREVITDGYPRLQRPVKSWEPPAHKQKEPQPSFFERHPDLEKFIGENLVNKIGIAILVLAIAFFVKYAIDNNWVGPVGRVGIGIVCGAVLIVFAHLLRNSYKAFSSVLVGGGLAVFYFTITLAYQEFHLFSQTTAFIILIVITLFAATLSLLYDKQELAVIALIGGLASPFMISNGTANYNALFIYLVILNVGLLIIAYFKAWRILNISAFALSVIVIASILFVLPAHQYFLGFSYASVFYLLFLAINIINNVRENKKFLSADFTLLLINTALYFGAGLFLLTQMAGEQYRGLFCAVLGIVNLALSFILFKKQKVDPNILYLLIGITLTFISLTAPIQLHGNNITLFWASETVLLYWLYQKSSITLMKLTSLLVWLAMFISLMMDLGNIYFNSSVQLTIVANQGFVTTIVGAISSYLLYSLLKKEQSPQIYGIAISKNLYRVVALVLLFLSGALEINHQFLYYYPTAGLNILYMTLYAPVFVYLFSIISPKVTGEPVNWLLGVGLLVCTIAIYLFLTPSFFDVLRDMLEKGKTSTSLFEAHWISALFIGLLFYQLIRLCLDNFDDDMKTFAAWILSASIVLFLSLEIAMAANLIFYWQTHSVDRVQTVYIKTGLPILWGVLSFILMWLGMHYKQRIYRIISLSLFLLTLLKLFLFDINDIPVAGKIAAFFCLGVLLLIISFMYQKVKKIMIKDEVEPKD